MGSTLISVNAGAIPLHFNSSHFYKKLSLDSVILEVRVRVQLGQKTEWENLSIALKSILDQS